MDYELYHNVFSFREYADKDNQVSDGYSLYLWVNNEPHNGDYYSMINDDGEGVFTPDLLLTEDTTGNYESFERCERSFNEIEYAKIELIKMYLARYGEPDGYTEDVFQPPNIFTQDWE